MKICKWLCLLILPFSLLSWTPEDEAEMLRQAQEEEKAYHTYIDDLNDLRCRFAKEMREELGLVCSGSPGRFYGTIEELGMDFYASRRATIEEARALHLLALERFVAAINRCEKIRPFMKPSPFTYKNVGISIIFSGANKRHSDGTVVRVSNVTDSANPPNQNCMFYSRWDPFSFDHIDLLMETREEAVERNQIAAIADPKAHPVTEKEEAIDQFLSAFRQQMAKKYKFNCWSIGGQMAENIEEVGAHFIVIRHASQEQARALVLDVADQLTQAINSNPKLKPYLAEDPFPASRLKLYIGFRKKKPATLGTYRDGSMESVTLDEGIVSYYQETPIIKGKEPPRVFSCGVPLYATETYEEAVEVIKASPKTPLYKRLLSKFFP